MEQEFESWSIGEFNTFGCSLAQDMTFSEAIKEIEDNGISYFYVSMNKQDVLEAIEADKETATGLFLIYIKGLGIYIALEQ